ncbi:MAG: DNRLRE domain-containing protein [Deltaproteobacteria bacterium]|nr:DNRLRE domain-containing protein [Deltaproteobacteria bacterium]
MGAGWNPTGGEKRAYLKFDLPAGLGSSRAVLKLYQDNMAGSVHTLGVYRVTSPWNEGTGIYDSGEVEQTAAPGELCWMQQPSFNPVPVATFNSATNVPAWVEVDITSLVQQWQTGTPNYGLVIKTTNDYPTKSDPESMSAFCTKEKPQQAYWPVLEL